MRAKFAIAFLLFAAAFCTVKGQTVEQLKNDISRTERRIKESERLLRSAEKDKSANTRQLQILDNRIRNRNKAIDLLNQSIDLTNSQITAREERIATSEQQIEQLKADYADMVRKAYFNNKTNTALLFLFASKDFNDITRRVDYMRRVNRLRVTRGKQLQQLTDSLSVERELLSIEKRSLDSTLTTRNHEVDALQSDRERHQTVGKELQDKQKTLSNSIRQSQRDKAAYQQKLDKLIAAGVKNAKAAKLTDKEKRDMAVLSDRFDQNRGKLPMPVDGVVIEHFGNNPHPTQKNIVTNNPGVNIAAESGAEVRAVFDGTVCGVYKYQDTNYILVRHGDFFTAYMNIDSFNVKGGERVRTNQRIGRIPASNDDERHYLHFEVWNGTTREDPEIWLY